MALQNGVRSGSDCAWTAVSNAAWITITSGSTGTANGTVQYAAAQNGSSTGRSGTLAVAGYTMTVTQAGS